MIHTLNLFNVQHTIQIGVIGCGGTGCSVAAGLPYLDQAIRARGGSGLEVTLIDGDRVSTVNRVRQPYTLEEVGLFKSVVLASRLNLMWGQRWTAVAGYVGDKNVEEVLRKRFRFPNTILLGCVDRRSARAAIRHLVQEIKADYWLDFGNDRTSGQFLLGQPEKGKRSKYRLPLPDELFPALVDADQDKDDEPSCSALEALERQQPFVNQTLAFWGLNLLSQLLWQGQIEYHGGFVDFASGRMSRLPVDPEVWKRIKDRQKRVARKLIARSSHGKEESQSSGRSTSGGARRGKQARAAD